MWQFQPKPGHLQSPSGLSVIYEITSSVLLRGINIETLDLRQLCTILRAQTGNDRDTRADCSSRMASAKRRRQHCRPPRRLRGEWEMPATCGKSTTSRPD